MCVLFDDGTHDVHLDLFAIHDSFLDFHILLGRTLFCIQTFTFKTGIWRRTETNAAICAANDTAHGLALFISTDNHRRWHSKYFKHIDIAGQRSGVEWRFVERRKLLGLISCRGIARGRQISKQLLQLLHGANFKDGLVSSYFK